MIGFGFLVDIWHAVRDVSHDILKREGEFTLQFVADFFRPNHSKQTSRTDNHTKHYKSKEEKLSKSEQKIFDEMLKRRKDEKQIEYWKRRKSLLSMTNKKRFVQQSMKSRQQELTQQKRETEAQNLLMKMQKNDKKQEADNLSKKM